MLYDWERGVLTRMIRNCIGGNSERARLLDVGCGYGRNLEIAASICSCIGVDVNPEAVQANNRRGLESYLPDKLPRSELGFDVILMSHVVEHFAPVDLLEF